MVLILLVLGVIVERVYFVLKEIKINKWSSIELDCLFVLIILYVNRDIILDLDDIIDIYVIEYLRRIKLLNFLEGD